MVLVSGNARRLRPRGLHRGTTVAYWRVCGAQEATALDEMPGVDGESRQTAVHGPIVPWVRASSRRYFHATLGALPGDFLSSHGESAGQQVVFCLHLTPILACLFRCNTPQWVVKENNKVDCVGFKSAIPPSPGSIRGSRVIPSEYANCLDSEGEC